MRNESQSLQPLRVFCDESVPDDGYANKQSAHQKRVESFLRGIGSEVPDRPRLDKPSSLISQGRLAMEELLEYFEAADIEVTLHYDASFKIPIRLEDLHFTFNGKPDLVKLVDAWADISVIATGGLSLNGISDEELLQEVDNNNLQKLANGRRCQETNKFIKPKDHVPPDIQKVLMAQGWDG